MRKFRLLFSLVLILGLSLLAACSDDSDSKSAKEEPENLSILTGGTGGTYYPLGGEIAQIMTEKTGKQVTAQSSGASVENMTTLSDNGADMAFVQTDIAAYAAEGKLMFKDNKIDNVQAIGTLYPETIHIVALADSGIETMEDLKGKTVSIGAPGSGTAENAKQILEIHGLSLEDIEVQNLSFDESTTGIQDGNIDAAFITSGYPTGAVDSLAALKDINIIPITEEKVKELAAKYPYYATDVIPAGTYGLEEDVPTAAVKALLVVREGLSESLVYDLTKSLFDNVDSITHSKGELISADKALDGVGIEVHPGAQKYFDEQ